MGLGRLCVEQGVFLCFAVGVGSLVLPLMSGAAPPPDLDASPRERRKVLVYGAAGAGILLSLILEQLGWARGVTEYLTKPIVKRELLTRIAAQLHSREIDRRLTETAVAL